MIVSKAGCVSSVVLIMVSARRTVPLGRRQMRTFAPRAPLHKNTVGLLAFGHNHGRLSGRLRECVGRKPRACPPNCLLVVIRRVWLVKPYRGIVLSATLAPFRKRVLFQLARSSPSQTSRRSLTRENEARRTGGFPLVKRVCAKLPEGTSG